jgi:hypothetical protein
MLYKRTINGMMLQFIQQLNGQNFVRLPFSVVVWFETLNAQKYSITITEIRSSKAPELCMSSIN